MPAHEGPIPAPIDWEAFYTNYRKPGYVPGYEILHKLGGGAFGHVFKARKESIGKEYAIKFLKVDDEAVRDAVLRELQTVRLFAQVDHPNLVSIEDRGEIDGIPFIIMGYAGDDTLRSRLQAVRGGALPRDEALRIFVQVARGVQALHDHSLVHFDLKPANVFLKGDLARVGDYGLSKMVAGSRNSLTFGRGTPYYMAPELLERRGDHRSDIYSLGVLLFEMLTGDVPFKGDSEWEVLRKHENETPRLPAGIGDPERAVVMRCLAKVPGDRYEGVSDLLADLQIAEATPTPAPTPGESGATAMREVGTAVEGAMRAAQTATAHAQRYLKQRAYAHRPVAAGSSRSRWPRMSTGLILAIVVMGVLFAKRQTGTSEARARAVYELAQQRALWAADATQDSFPRAMQATAPQPRRFDEAAALRSISRIAEQIGRFDSVSYPRDVSSRTRRIVERELRDIERARYDRAGLPTAVAQNKLTATVHILNRLRKLDYSDGDDLRLAKRYGKILAEIADHSRNELPFRVPSYVDRKLIGNVLDAAVEWYGKHGR